MSSVVGPTTETRAMLAPTRAMLALVQIVGAALEELTMMVLGNDKRAGKNEWALRGG